MNIATPARMAMATAVSASYINAGATLRRASCASDTRPARKPSWTGPARPCRSATVTPARYGRRPCSSPRSAPVPTPGRRSRDQQMESWLLAHVHALEHWGGVPLLVVPDNTKTGVTKACVMIRMSIRLIRTSPHTTASACYRRDRISPGQGDRGECRAGGATLDLGGTTAPQVLLAGRSQAGGCRTPSADQQPAFPQAGREPRQRLRSHRQTGTATATPG